MRVLDAEPTTRRQIRPLTLVVNTVLVVVLALLVWPLGRMIQLALFPEGAFSTEIFLDLFRSTGLRTAVANTVVLVITSNLIAVPIAIFFGWLTERTDARLGRFTVVLPVIPLLLPGVALSIGWVLLGHPRAGLISHWMNLALEAVGMPPIAIGVEGWPGLIFLYGIFLVPPAYVVIAAAFRTLDPSLEEAGRIAGKSKTSCFFRIAVPSIRRSIGSAAFLVTMGSIAVYSIPVVVGTRSQITVLSVYIWRLLHAQYPAQFGHAVGIGLMLIVVLGALWLAERKLSGARASAAIGGMGVRTNRIRLGRARRPAQALLIGYVFCTSVLPLLALVVVSFQSYWTPSISMSEMSLDNYRNLLDRLSTVNALRNSSFLALTSATVTVGCAALLALGSDGRTALMERVAGIGTKAPAAISNIVLAVGLLVALGGAPFYLSGTLWILLVAYCLVYLPQASVAAESAMSQVGRQLSEASRVYGASAGETVRRIQLPLMSSGLAAGWAIVFAAALGDLQASAILSGGPNPVIGYEILNIFENSTFSRLAALASVIAVASFFIVSIALLRFRPRFSRTG